MATFKTVKLKLVRATPAHQLATATKIKFERPVTGYHEYYGWKDAGTLTKEVDVNYYSGTKFEQLLIKGEVL